jgi:hypothetical protein
MKITSFNPFIATARPDETVSLFEEMGFEKRHIKQGIEIADRNDTVIRMKDANGFHLDVLQSNEEQPRDSIGIRMNVDDFDEACRMLLDHGFRNVYGGETVQTGSSKAAMMVSPSGFCISVIQHLKKPEM